MAVTIQTQPNSSGITYSRSPVVYRFAGCDQLKNYVYNIYITTGTTASLTTIYASVNRKPDSVNGITINASMLLQNYLRNNLVYNAENVVYFKSSLQEFSGTTLVNTYTSNIAIATLGYTTAGQGGRAEFNLTDEYDNTDYIMNHITNNEITLPNYSWNNSYTLNWRTNTTGEYYFVIYPTEYYLYTTASQCNSGATLPNGTVICSPLPNLSGYTCNLNSGPGCYTIGGSGTKVSTPTGHKIAGVYAICNDCVRPDWILLAGSPVVVWYGDSYAVVLSRETSFNINTNSSGEIMQIPCGYSDLSLYNLPPYTNSYRMTIREIPSNKYTHINIKPDNCNGNDLVKLMYLNKWGVWDYFFFKGKKSTQINTTYETYKYNKVNYNTMTYDVSDGSYHKQFVQGREKMTLNTGWLNESDNIKIQDLLLSEYILLETYYPYIITSTEQKFKTTRFDKMINYTIELESSYDAINNII